MPPPSTAGSGGAADIRASISYCVALLGALGVSGLSAEALRQAKFDAAAPAERLWRALHDLVALALAGFPRAGAPAGALDAAWRAGAPRGGVPAEGARSRRLCVTLRVASAALRRAAALRSGAVREAPPGSMGLPRSCACCAAARAGGSASRGRGGAERGANAAAGARMAAAPHGRAAARLHAQAPPSHGASGPPL